MMAVSYMKDVIQSLRDNETVIVFCCGRVRAKPLCHASLSRNNTPCGKTDRFSSLAPSQMTRETNEKKRFDRKGESPKRIEEARRPAENMYTPKS